LESSNIARPSSPPRSREIGRWNAGCNPHVNRPIFPTYGWPQQPAALSEWHSLLTLYGEKNQRQQDRAEVNEGPKTRHQALFVTVQQQKTEEVSSQKGDKRISFFAAHLFA
jgi:hypothetical protein